MKVFIIDISGKVTGYDLALFRALKTVDSYDDLCFVAPDIKADIKNVKHLISFIPSKYKFTENKIKRIIKAFEGVVNYFYVLLMCVVWKPDIVHFQWFPYMEFCSVDIFFVRLITVFKRELKIVLTVHNVYPHIINENKKDKYRNRFRKMSKYIDRYIVHTQNSKKELITDFSILPDIVTIIPHGIFTPDYKPKYKRTERQETYHIIMYGNNLPYKGSDILLDAIQLLPSEYKNRIKVTIVGATSNDYLDLLKSKAIGLNVIFNPTFVPDDILYEMIDEADYIALPYKKISQSGVLLLALYFKKPLLISNLPSFVETLDGFTPDMFFESENPEALKDLIVRHLDGKVDINKQMSAISELNELYSWGNSAMKTLGVYKGLY